MSNLNSDTERVIGDVFNERLRQVQKEGWTLAHDDEHKGGEMAKAAACYAWASALPETTREIFRLAGGEQQSVVLRRMWPWEWLWFKPTDCRYDLVKAAALIVAEIERIDRAEGIMSMSRSVSEPGLIRTPEELKRVVDRRLEAAVDLRKNARRNGETADWNWANGAVDELMIVQDLLCIILNQPRTYAAQR